MRTAGSAHPILLDLGTKPVLNEKVSIADNVCSSESENVNVKFPLIVGIFKARKRNKNEFDEK
jgi:hypothetical protein